MQHDFESAVRCPSSTEAGICQGLRRQRLMKKRVEEDSSWMFPWPVTQPPSSGVSTKGSLAATDPETCTKIFKATQMQ